MHTARPVVCQKLLEERISAIAFMSTHGVLDCETVTGSVDGEVFYNFVQASLLPHLMPFDGRNPQCSCGGQLFYPSHGRNC